MGQSSLLSSVAVHDRVSRTGPRLHVGGSAAFDPNSEWLETYPKPGVSFEYQRDSGATLYGKLSAVASYTIGTDAFDTGDTWGAKRVDDAGSIVIGVTDAQLADDFFLEQSRIINRNMFLTSGISASIPGEGN